MFLRVTLVIKFHVAMLYLLCAFIALNYFLKS